MLTELGAAQRTSCTGRARAATQRPSQRPSEPPHPGAQTWQGIPSPPASPPLGFRQRRAWEVRDVVTSPAPHPHPPLWVPVAAERERERERGQAAPVFPPDTAPRRSYPVPRGPLPHTLWIFLETLLRERDFSWCCSDPSPPGNPEPHTSGSLPFTSSPPGSRLLPAAPRAAQRRHSRCHIREPCRWDLGVADGARGGRPAALGSGVSALVQDTYPESSHRSDEGKPESEDVVQNEHSGGCPRKISPGALRQCPACNEDFVDLSVCPGFRGPNSHCSGDSVDEGAVLLLKCT
ncbi:uncharacterized protein LOC125088185 [Lutra lutra]|uniref:uncharacterized protein LOC125088185 n=1 Tax=Lutra lutra TaxID=9657 RepID=UPI001FD463B2|nr:uncharacterized protein LOC125088185 [Lutra lutra]